MVMIIMMEGLNMSTLEIHKNSITNLHTDAVVNAANSPTIPMMKNFLRHI